MEEPQATPSSKRAMTLSVIAPVYNEKETLTEFADRLFQQLMHLPYTSSVVFIDDGSTDQTSQILANIQEKHPSCTIIQLSRNFGHQRAISAGIDYIDSDLVVIMDSDLQDPPEVIPEFLKLWEQGFEVVYGIRKNRQENLFKKFCYNSFYRILRALSDIEMPLDAGDFSLMTRPVLNEMKKFPERNRFLRGIRSWVGFKQIGMEYDRDKRYSGKPKYTIRKLVTLALDGLIAFSYRPLRAISLTGIGISISSFLLALYFSIQKIKFGLNPPGFATTVVAIFFFSGIQLVTLGILGEYLGRIYEEIKQRPLYIIKKIVR